MWSGAVRKAIGLGAVGGGSAALVYQNYPQRPNLNTVAQNVLAVSPRRPDLTPEIPGEDFMMGSAVVGGLSLAALLLSMFKKCPPNKMMVQF